MGGHAEQFTPISPSEGPRGRHSKAVMGKAMAMPMIQTLFRALYG